MTGRDLIWVIIGAVVIIGLVNNPENEVETAQQRTYCEMVHIYKETKGAYGWPDYRGNFRKVCK